MEGCPFFEHWPPVATNHRDLATGNPFVCSLDLRYVDCIKNDVLATVLLLRVGVAQ